MKHSHWITLPGLLKIAAILEIVTGAALMICPLCATLLLLNSELVGAGLAICRVAGFGLLSLGIACWPTAHTNTMAPLAILTYGLLITAYLVYLGVATLWVGWLLWPAVAVHAVLTALLAWRWTQG